MQIQFRVWQAYRTAIGALLLLCLLASCAQASSLGCQKSLGGGQEVQSVQETADGGYAVAGNAQSNDSLVSNNSVGNDHSGNINCTITAHDVVCPSTSNLASTAESGAAYSWSITNGMILEGSHARMIKFGAGASGTIRLTVDVSKNGSNASCFKDIPIALPNCSWTSNAPVFNGTPVQFTAPAGMDGYYWDFGDGSEPIKGLCNSSHLYPRPGTYNVSLTVTSCGSSEKCRGSVFVAIIPVWTSNATVPGEAAEELAPTMETGPPKGSPTAARQARERTGSASTQDSLTDFGAPSRPP
jgi:hypothetical protein